MSPNKRILIIDDNVTNLKVAIQQLAAYGLDIVIARNGERGLERAAYAQPDLILLDVQMPGIDGFETCRRLKADEVTRDIPVIFMTALSDVADKVRGFAVGGVDYVTKPIQAEEVWARVKTHLTIRDLQLEMSERISELDAFAHTVAHDLKSPLSRIVTGLDLLQDMLATSLDEQSAQIMEISVNGSHQMARIIDELLLLASVRQGDVPTEPLDMGGIVLGAKERLSHVIEERQAEIILPETWPIAVGHAPWLEEVWANYLSNGLKYGGDPPRLELGGEMLPNGQARFWVQDNGKGLTEAEQAKLFQEFSRVKNQSIKGHGLGLSIVNRIITRLEGEVGVESEVGKGSRFYFTLPTVQQPAQENESAVPTAVSSDERPLPMHILIADDNPTNQQMLILGLEQLGHTVEAVGNGQEALTAVSQQHYDLIFMDGAMPVMDGLEATRQIRQHPNLPAQPIILAYTANADDTYRQFCLDAGMNGFVSKPVDMDKLVHILAPYGKQNLTTMAKKEVLGEETPALSTAKADVPTILDTQAINKLRQMAGNDASNIILLIDTFLEDASRQIAKLQEAAAAENAKGIYMAAHSLKSLGNNFGAAAFAALSREIELAASDGDVHSAAAKVPHLLSMYAQVDQAMLNLKEEVNSR